MERTNVLGVGVSVVNMQSALDTIETWILSGQSQYVCATSMHGVMEAQNDKRLKSILNGAGMITPDGMPLVWLSKLAGHREVTRVYGPDLMLALCKLSAERGYKQYLYGGATEVPEQLKTALCDRFPGLDVVGAYSPPFRTLTEQEDEEIMEAINSSGADVVWVGLGMPKQDYWVAEHVAKLDRCVLIAVGAAFDFHSGRKKQAPLWIQRSGLEWLFRLLSEPKRLWRRYLVNIPQFIVKAILQKVGLVRYELES